MSTPHNQAQKGDIAKVVLMPGDPLRAKFIAETFLTDTVCYNTTRNMFGYTGKYNNISVSVQGSGMGMPSMGIYSYELFNEYDVDCIIRIGTAGAISENVKLKDIVFGQAACTDSNYANQYELSGTYAPVASYDVLEKAVSIARKKGFPYHVGNILSSDVFYSSTESLKRWGSMNVLAVEMESAALYMNAAKAGKKALCITTISDCPLIGLSTSATERQTAFTNMMEVALETAINYQNI